MIEHLIKRALHSLLSEREEAQHDEAHVTDRRVRNQAFYVRLHHRYQRAIDDPDYGQRDHDGRELPRRIREQAKVKAQQSIRAHLEQDAGEDYGTGSRRFGVRIRQPGMERPQRNLNTEGEGKSEKQPVLGPRREYQRVASQRLNQDRIVERADAGGLLMDKVERDDTDQHQQRPDRGIDEKLDCRIDAPLAAPNANQEEHRDQRCFKEQIEEQ